MAPRSPKPSSLPAPAHPKPTLRGELTRPYIYWPLLLSSLLFLLSLWDQSPSTLSFIWPVLFLWLTILLPLPFSAHLLWFAARAAWAWWDSYRELARVLVAEGIMFLLLLPVLEDIRRAVRAAIPFLPQRAERKGLEVKIVLGWTLAQAAKAVRWALGKLAGVSSVSGDAYAKALAPESEMHDRGGFLTARLNSILRATSSLSLTTSTSTSTSFSLAAPTTSPEDGPSTSPVKRKVGRPRRSTANPYALDPAAPAPALAPASYPSPPPSASKATANTAAAAGSIAKAARTYRVPASPPPSEERELGQGVGVGEQVPDRRYATRRGRQADVDTGRTPEALVALEQERERGKAGAWKGGVEEVKREEETVSPVKRGRGRPKKVV